MRLAIVTCAMLVVALCFASFAPANAAMPSRGAMSVAAGAFSDTVLVKKKGIPGWMGRRHCPPGQWKKGAC
jgi:hypothetical protein